MADTPNLGQKFNLITLFDVFNQAPVGDRATLLHKFKETLQPDGFLVMREPAMKIASGRHDIDVNIQERFEKKTMQKLLEDAGFEVLYNEYMNSLLFVPIVLARKIGALMNAEGKSDVTEHNLLSNAFLLTLLRLEKVLFSLGIKFPFGVSLFTIARKNT